MATIELKQVEKKFGDFQAVKPMNLTITDGEFTVEWEKVAFVSS